MRWLFVSLLAAALLAGAHVHAAEESEEAFLENARQTLTAIEKKLPQAKDDRSLLDLRAQALALQSRLQEATARIEPQLAKIEARIAELGAAPAENESGDLAERRRELEQTRATLEGQLTLAKLLWLEAEQAAAQISARSRTRFRQHLSDRTSAPLGPQFWANLKAERVQDARRARAFAAEVKTALLGSSPLAWVGVLIAAIAVFVAQRRLMLKLLRIAQPGRLRRSLRALIRVVLPTFSAAVIIYATGLALASGAEPAPHLAAALPGAGLAILFGVYVAALGTALLSVGAPSWRLPAISDEAAARLRQSAIEFALVVALASLIEQLASAINVSPGMSVALNSLMTLVLAVTLARVLGAASVQARIAISAKTSGRPAAPASAVLPPWLAIIIGIGWIIVAGSALCVLIGYIALGSFAVRQVAWVVIVLCTAYLLASAADDLVMTVLGGARAILGQPVSATRTSTAVLLSALARFTIALLALAVLVAPYGAGAIDLLPHLHRLQEGISIGAIQLRPGALGRGILILALGIGAVRMVRRWTERHYLPSTRMDAGMRASVTSLVGYAGYGIVIALTLSALGVGLQQIAWVASALALGIGFGLQAIVQNFVSGLILIAERPIKVGDWVELGTFEGNVQRINARATEIQRADRSTVIVPNSEFITKAVRNVTYANPLGLVQIKLPVPVGSDVERVRAELLHAFQGHENILRVPEPTVMLDGIEGGNILFNAQGFVISPRAAYATRSAVLFDSLVRLKKAGIIAAGPTAAAAKPPATRDEKA